MIKGVQVSLLMKLITYQVKTYAFYTCITAYKSKGLSIGGLLLSKKIYAFYTRSTAYKKEWGSRSVVSYSTKKIYAFYMRSTTYKSKRFPIGGPLLSKNIILFTRIASRTKSKGAPDRRSHTQQFFYTFYTRSTVYKKQEPPDRRSLTQQKKLCFLHA
jgi:hypothetical protein